MRYKQQLMAVIIITASTSTSTFAESQYDWEYSMPVYFSASYEKLTIKDPKTIGESHDLSALGAIAGFKINDYVSVEAKLAGGINDDSLEPEKGYLFLDHQIGAYAKIEHSFYWGNNNYSVTPMLTIGMSQINLTANNAKLEYSSFSYGAGIGFNFSPKTRLTLSYMNYVDNGGISIYSSQIGLSYSL